MAQLSSRLVISLVDRVSGPAKKIHQSLRGLDNLGNSVVALGRNARRTGDHLRGFGTSAAVAGYGMYTFLNATDEFNKSAWGYTFANLNDHFKGLRVDMKALNADTRATTDEVRKVAAELGLLPSVVMRARTEVAKVGAKGDLGDALFRAALGMNVADENLPADQASKWLWAMYGNYEKERGQLAKKMGLDLSDPAQRGFFDREWLRSTAAKGAVAAATSSLDPGELVEGLRVFAPQWAAMGMAPEVAMAFLAHGSSKGFGASELGTAARSWGGRIVKPTATGVGWMNTLQMDRSRFSTLGAQSPQKATTALHNLLSNQLYVGKGSKEFRGQIRQMLDEAARSGTTATPEFQGQLTDIIMKRLGSKWAGRGDDVAAAVADATLTSDGQGDVVAFIKEGLKRGMSTPQMLEIMEGRHIARNTPYFEFFDAFVQKIQELEKVDSRFLDETERAWKESPAGKMSALRQSWAELLLTIQDSGLNDRITSGLKSVINTLATLDPKWIELAGNIALVTAVAAPLASLTLAIAGALGSLWAALRVGKALLGLFGLGRAAAGGAAAAGGIGLAELFGGALATKVFGTKEGKAIADRMSLSGKDAENKRIGQKIAEGMSGGGAGGGAAKGGGWMSKLWGVGKAGAKALPFIGTALALYAAYEALWGSDAEAAGVPTPGRTVANAGGHVARGTLPPGAHYQPGEENKPSKFDAQPDTGPVVNGINNAMNQVRSIVAGVDLTAEGTRIANTLANGIKAGIPAIQSAASQAAAAASRSALRGAYTDGAR